MFHEFYGSEKNLASSTRNTRNTWNTWNTQTNPSNRIYEPPCVSNARNTPSVNALKIIIAYYRKKRNEAVIKKIVDTFLKVHEKELQIDPSDLPDLLYIPEFSCDLVKSLAPKLCDEAHCQEKLNPADRLILATESVLVFHSTSELDVRVNGKRKIIPLQKIIKERKDGLSINTALFNKLYFECFYTPPIPPFTEEMAWYVFNAWLENAEIVKDVLDPETALEEAVIEIITTKRDFYKYELLKNGTVPPTHGFFVDDNGVIYIDSGLFRDLLNDMGVKDRPEKVSRACRRILAGRTKRIRVGKDNKDLRYFWRFNLSAIQTILKREGDDWEPEIKETFEIADVLKNIGLNNPDEDEERTGEDNPPEDSDSDTAEMEIDLSGDLMEEEFRKFLEGDDND